MWVKPGRLSPSKGQNQECVCVACSVYANVNGINELMGCRVSPTKPGIQGRLNPARPLWVFAVPS